jgi:hypothetical protein
MPDGAVVSQAQFMLPAPLAGAPPMMVEQRTRVMLEVADIIYAKMVKSIGTEMDYKTKIAGPSASGYASVLNPLFVSRSGLNRDQIVQKQERGVMGGFRKHQKSVTHMFETVNGEVAKRFRDAVKAKSEIYSQKMGEVLAITGALVELGKGLVGLAVFWMAGDPTTQRHLRGDDKLIAGGPLNISIHSPTFKAALTQRLTQSARTLMIANWHPKNIKDENDLNNLIIRRLQKDIYVPFETGGPSHCDWIVVDGRIYLEIKVSAV